MNVHYMSKVREKISLIIPLLVFKSMMLINSVMSQYMFLF